MMVSMGVKVEEGRPQQSGRVAEGVAEKSSAAQQHERAHDTAGHPERGDPENNDSRVPVAERQHLDEGVFLDHVLTEGFLRNAGQALRTPVRGV